MKKLCLLILGFSFCFAHAHTKVVSAPSMDYKGLFDDLKKYKKIKGECHAGHLYEHMVWVAKAVDKLFENNSPWVKDIDPKDRTLLTIAGFMHDIGKAGDLEYNYSVKRTHPRAGFEYILGKRKYLLDSSGATYNFDEWLAHMNITQEDKAALAVLIGMHQEFGIMLRNMKNNPETALQGINTFIADLEGYVHEANYNGGVPDERIARMSIALCRADLQGMFPVEQLIALFPDLKDHPQTLDAVPIASGKVMDTAGYLVAQELLKHFKRRLYAYMQGQEYKA